MTQIKILFFLSVICAISIIVLIGMMLKGQDSTKISVASPTPTSIQKPQFIIKGSIPYWDQDHAFFSFKNNVAIFNYVNIFWYYLSDTGTIKKYKDAFENKYIIDFAHANNVKALAVVTNLSDVQGTTWDSKRVERVIQSKSSRDKHINDIVKKIEELGFDGVIIDYEEVEASQKNKFSVFIGELSNALHKNGKIVALALYPKTSDSDNTNGAFQDWEALARNADQLNIMAYGQHWDESNSGPIASIVWVKDIVKYAETLNLPKDKLFLGIPLYGYDWNKNNQKAAQGVTYDQTQQLLVKYRKKEKWNEKSKSPYFFYEDNGDTHEVWFENARSVQGKIELAQKAGFAGVTFWRLGEEDPDVWKVVNSLR